MALDFFSWDVGESDLLIQGLMKLAPGPMEALGYGSGSTMTGFTYAFQTFNFAMLSLAVLLLGGNLLKSATDSAREGKLFSQKVNIFTGPLKAGMVIALLTPLPGGAAQGYSMAQVGVIAVAVQGVQTGSDIWNSFNGVYVAGGPIMDADGKAPTEGTRLLPDPSVNGGEELAKDFLQKEACLANLHRIEEGAAKAGGRDSRVGKGVIAPLPPEEGEMLLPASRADFHTNEDDYALYYASEYGIPNVREKSKGEREQYILETYGEQELEEYRRKRDEFLATQRKDEDEMEAAEGYGVYSESHSDAKVTYGVRQAKVVWDYGACGDVALDMGGTPTSPESEVKMRWSEYQDVDEPEHTWSYHEGLRSEIGEIVSEIRSGSGRGSVSLAERFASGAGELPDLKAALGGIANGFELGVQKRAGEYVRQREAGTFESLRDRTVQAGVASAGSFYINLALLAGQVSDAANRKPSFDAHEMATLIGDAEGRDRERYLAPLDRVNEAWERDFEAASITSGDVGREIADLRDAEGQGGPDGEGDDYLAFFDDLMERQGAHSTFKGDAFLSSGNPVGDIIAWGNDIKIAGWAVLSSVLVGGVALTPLIGGLLLTAPLAWALALGQLFVGYGMQYVVPLLPAVVWYFALAGWFVFVVEALIAIPLLLIFATKLDEQPELKQGFIKVAAVGFKLPIMVLSLIVVSALYKLLLWLLGQLFYPAVMGATGGTLGPVTYVIFLVVLLYMLIQVTVRSWSLIGEMTDRVMRWLGVDAGSGEMENQSNAASSAIGGYLGAKGASKVMGQGARSAESTRTAAGAKADQIKSNRDARKNGSDAEVSPSNDPKQ